MAVTEAGCDITYCKMRGIVGLLAGERLEINLNEGRSFFFAYLLMVVLYLCTI